MNPDDGAVPALLEWLGSDHDPGREWEPEPAAESLRCRPDLVARLAEAARPLGAVQRRFVAGCPVIGHPEGRPIAAAAGTSWLVARSGLPAGALSRDDARTPALGDEWVELDPWASAVAFARVVDLLRAHLARAYELAGTHA